MRQPLKAPGASLCRARTRLGFQASVQVALAMLRTLFFGVTGYRNFTKDGYLKASKSFDDRCGAAERHPNGRQ